MKVFFRNLKFVDTDTWNALEPVLLAERDRKYVSCISFKITNRNEAKWIFFISSNQATFFFFFFFNFNVMKKSLIIINSVLFYYWAKTSQTNDSLKAKNFIDCIKNGCWTKIMLLRRKMLQRFFFFLELIVFFRKSPLIEELRK